MKIEKAHLVLVFLVLVAGMTLLIGCPTPNPRPHETVKSSQQTMRDAVAIFFNKTQGSRNITEEVIRQVPPEERNNVVKFALEELFAGPTPEEKEEGYFSEIPRGTKLLNVQKSGDTLKLDLSHKFSYGAGATTVIQRMEQIKQTVFSADSTNKIFITIEGRPLEVVSSDGLEVPQPIRRDIK